jgi:hypothetical protein
MKATIKALEATPTRDDYHDSETKWGSPRYQARDIAWEPLVGEVRFDGEVVGTYTGGRRVCYATHFDGEVTMHRDLGSCIIGIKLRHWRAFGSEVTRHAMYVTRYAYDA